jgi:hypothetical protein
MSYTPDPFNVESFLVAGTVELNIYAPAHRNACDKAVTRVGSFRELHKAQRSKCQVVFNQFDAGLKR